MAAARRPRDRRHDGESRRPVPLIVSPTSALADRAPGRADATAANRLESSHAQKPAALVDCTVVEPALLTDRADRTDEVAGRAFGGRGIGHVETLRADRRRPAPSRRASPARARHRNDEAVAPVETINVLNTRPASTPSASTASSPKDSTEGSWSYVWTRCSIRARTSAAIAGVEAATPDSVAPLDVFATALTYPLTNPTMTPCRRSTSTSPTRWPKR